MSPNLKNLHRAMQREFCKNRKSQKFIKLKTKFKKLKKKSIRTVYSEFVQELKSTDPAKWYYMAKKIGAVSNKRSDTEIESLSGLSNKESANRIAQHFSEISNQYSPIDYTQLPNYLPAPPPPQVEEMEIYQKIKSIKKTKSTLPIDIPAKLRDHCAIHLAAPLALIINNSLASAVYPAMWKQEWVTPAPKVTNPKGLEELRKISCTSDYSKLYESYLKKWIMEDLKDKIDIGQFGGQAGVGTEHMIVCYIDRILRLLDTHSDKAAVIATSLDWASAFDRQDPTLAILKFIKMGVRPSLIPLLASYLTDRTMRVKFKSEISDLFSLIGGGPQGTLLGGIEYLVQSNDNADFIPEEDRFKYVDDLSLLQFVCLTGLLVDYDFYQHVASDIGIEQKYLPTSSATVQDNLNHAANWTTENLMALNTAKCNFMIFTRSSNFTTRLTIEGKNLERVNVSKLLGIWITDDLSWAKNCQEICKKAFSRLSMITKLKYVGVPIEHLLDIYILFIRSVAEYCAVAFHSSLTREQSEKLEKIQKTSLKVILGESYISYEAALEMCNLETLAERREKRCLDFALKCTKHERNSRIFPLNPVETNLEVRKREKFHVNFARTSHYKNSAIPYCQRKLNYHFQN